MTGLTEWGVVGVIAVLVGLAGTVVTWTNASNKRWDQCHMLVMIHFLLVAIWKTGRVQLLITLNQ